MWSIETLKWNRKKKNLYALQNFLKLPNIHPFVPKLVPGLGSSFKRCCIVEVLKQKQTKHIITPQEKTKTKIIQWKTATWKRNSLLTLSSLELFMAFRAAESINIGGPSSKTSLMNSFACGQKIKLLKISLKIPFLDVFSTSESFTCRW